MGGRRDATQWEAAIRAVPHRGDAVQPGTGLGAEQRYLRPGRQPQPEHGLTRVGLRAAAQRRWQSLLRAVADRPSGLRRPVHAGPRNRGRARLRRPITFVSAAVVVLLLYLQNLSSSEK